MLESLGLLKIILPDVADMRKQEQPPQFHPEGDVLTHTIMMLDDMAYRDTVLTYATLFHDVGKPVTATHDGTRIRFNCHAERGAEMACKIMKDLHFSTKVIDDVALCVRNHMRFIDVQKMRKATLRRFIGGSTFETEMELHRLDCSASHGMLDNYEFLKTTQGQMANEPVLPAHWISGRDIMDLGVKEGPEIGKWIKVTYDVQLNGEQPDREALLGWLKKKPRCKSR
jgi:poly(A) polymerase